MNNISVTPFGDSILYGCDHGLCRYCEYDPYPNICFGFIKKSPKGRRIKEIRNMIILD